jgi:hypothetical protein
MSTENEISSTGENGSQYPRGQTPSIQVVDDAPSLELHDSEYLPVDAGADRAPVITYEQDGQGTQVDPTEPTHPEIPVAILEPAGIPDNVDFDENRPLTKILTKEEREQFEGRPEEVLYLPTESADRMVEYFNKIPNISDEGMNQKNVEWVAAHQGGLQFIPRFGAFKRTLKRKGARFRQSVVTKTGELAPAIPREDTSVMGVLSGDKAIRQIYHVMGLAGQVTIPLWHSGFWITIRQPSEAAILELKHRIALEKINMGRATSGLVYSNSTVFMAEHVVDMVMEHLHTNSINLPAGENIRKYILTSDLQILAWGLASAIWSKGFHYERAVLDDTGSASRVVVEKLNLLRMMVVDNSALNEWQKSHMTNRRPGSMTVEAVKRYQDDFALAQGNTLTINNRMHLRLKTPPIDAYLQQGTRWVNSIVDMINRTLGQDLDEQVRNTFVSEHSKTSTMRQYSHWVHEIVYPNTNGQDEARVEATESIDATLAAASRDPEMVKTYMRGVRDFIDDVTFACVCIPFLDEKDQNVYRRHPNLIPLDALHTFFTLIDQRARLIQMRETD